MQEDNRKQELDKASTDACIVDEIPQPGRRQSLTDAIASTFEQYRATMQTLADYQEKTS
jgi:hypothetical protein